MSMRTKFFLGIFLTICLLPFEARAHWCDDLWASSYNIVVRPATDTVTLSGGSATMDISVQNNMGYALPNFVLTAKIGTTNVTATRKTGALAGTTLYPGQKAQYTLAVTGTGTSVKIEDISFLVSFGNSGESKCYPTKGADAVMVKKNDGTLVPSANPPPGLSSPANPGCTGDMTQARQSQYAAQTDFINVSAGLDTLMNYYCAGRGTWNSQSDAVITTGCSGTATVCTKGTGTGAGTKWQYPHLWASLELVARKSALGATRITTLRQRLQCGAQDANTGFAGFAMMMLGYLGDDGAGNTFLVGQAGGTGDLATIAKAALLIATSNKTTYEAAVKTGLTSGTVFVKAACAAAIGIVDLDDATVTSTLVPLTKWTEPDTSDNGQSIYAAYLLSLVAWDRRCWAANAGDVGAVSFYEGGTAARCTGAGGSTGGSTGSTGAAGNTGTGGNTGAGGKAATGGSTSSGGSTVAGGNTATGGKTGTANSGTTGTPPIGGTAVTGGKTGTAGGGTTGTPTGGTTGTLVGGTTGTPVGGTTGTPVGGTTGTPVAGNQETGGNTALGTGGSPGGGSSEIGGGAAGGTPVETGGSTGAGLGGQTGNGGAPGSGSASQNGSAGGCGYAPSGRATIPLGFVLAGVGLAFAVRRRRRR
jgi:hypothetical protein